MMYVDRAKGFIWLRWQQQDGDQLHDCQRNNFESEKQALFQMRSNARIKLIKLWQEAFVMQYKPQGSLKVCSRGIHFDIKRHGSQTAAVVYF